MMQARSGMEIIPRNESLRLLASQEVGRLGFLDGDEPMVLPVNYAIEYDVIVFRTGEGSKLDAVPLAKVAFEVDDLDPGTRSGWSVVVRGMAEEITDDDDWFVDELRRVVVPTWILGATEHYVRINASSISGRRLCPAPTPRSDVNDATEP